MQLRNTLKTTLLLAALTGLLMFIGSAIGGQTGMIIAFVLSVQYGAWWFSDKMALRMSNARMVRRSATCIKWWKHFLCGQEFPKPALYLIDSDAPNAFATVAHPAVRLPSQQVSCACLIMRDRRRDRMDWRIFAIAIHCLASLVATIAGAITMIAEIAQWSLIFGGFGGSDEGEEGGGIAEMASSLMMLFLAPIAAMIIQMAISRSREFRADAVGAEILGNPLPLASALEKLEWAAKRQPMALNPTTSHLYIVNPILGGLGNLFRTHPETAQRVTDLR